VHSTRKAIHGLYRIVEQPNITQKHAEVNFCTTKNNEQQDLAL